MILFGYRFWLLQIAFLCLTYLQLSESFSDEDKEAINSGLQAGIGIVDLLESQKFSKTLSNLASAASPYLGAVAPFVGLIMSFLPSEESREEKLLKKVLEEMKRMMERIDDRFDKLENRFIEVEKLIKWNVVGINFGQIEQKILAMTKEYEYLYKVPPSALKNRIVMFITSYESDYQNSGTKLYEAIVSQQGTFQENLGSSVLRFTDNNCLQTQKFLLGVMQLVLQASKVELTYLKLKQYENNLKYMKSEWERKIKDISDNFKAVDKECTKDYQKRSRAVAIDFAIKHKYLSNREFATKLYKILSEKYYWREWIVLVYNGISGGKNHYVRWCDGHILHHHTKWRRNFDISSKEVNETIANNGTMTNYLTLRRKSNAIISYYYTYDFRYRWYNTNFQARDMLRSVPDVCNVAVIKYRLRPNLWYMHSKKIRRVHVLIRPYYHIYMWE